MLERHHTPPFEQSHRTTYRELGNLCPKHHDLVTNKHYSTTDNHDGTWDLHAPANAPADAPADARADTPAEARANAPPDEAAA